MVFFQSVLLLGYLYAHLITTYLRFPVQILVHGVVMVLALLFLPIAIPAGWEPDPAGAPTLWLIGLFSVAIGAPFFALSANAPLLQKWFSYTDHEQAGDPYFLYAASNIGSLTSLLAYPLVIEPFMGLSQQTNAWTVGFVLLIALILGSAYLSWKSAKASQTFEDATDGMEDVKRPGPGLIARWLGLSLLPSALMIAVTAHLTSNVASAPFLWVLPLALYLATFIFAFSGRNILPPGLMNFGYPVLLGLAIYVSLLTVTSFAFEFAVTMASFFVVTQHSHNLLAQSRPHVRYLTGFYFIMSLGGVIGGAMTALAAPLLLSQVYEYQILLVAAGLLAGNLIINAGTPLRNASIALIAAAITIAALTWLLPVLDGSLRVGTATLILCAVVAAIIIRRSEPVALVAALAVLAVFVAKYPLTKNVWQDDVVFADRSFFGALRVQRKDTEHGVVHTFIHGNTRHNVQLLSEEHGKTPLSYYGDGGSFDLAIENTRSRLENPTIGVVGLGAGALACQTKQGETWKFYEIDPMVIELARDQRFFSYVSDCAPNAPLIPGDARLTLAKEKRESFDLIMIDAFSSNAIPAHLVTREAIRLYSTLLSRDGVLFFHTSNRFLDVSSVVGNAAMAEGFAVRKVVAAPHGGIVPDDTLMDTSVGVIAGNPTLVEQLGEQEPKFERFAPKRSVGTWTDDYSNVLGALLAGR